MTPSSSSNRSAMRDRLRALAGAVGEVLLLVILMVVVGGYAPPGENEAHYLCKAKHYWNPDYCPGDAFLDSRDAHLVFYWTFGWITLLVQRLETVAWIGRLIGWTLLACSWRSLSRAIWPQSCGSFLTCGLFLLFLKYCHAGGEWVVGGIEAKVFAFALVFWGWAAQVQGRIKATWLFLGAGAAFHVLVGGWAMIATAIAWLIRGSDRPGLREILPWMAVGFVLSLPGLIPGLLLNRGLDRETIHQANSIYLDRLYHHLVPSGFDGARAQRHQVLWIVYFAFLLSERVSGNFPLGRLRRVVLGGWVIAAAGVVIDMLARSDRTWAESILRYYFFRMSDVLLPLGVAMETVAALSAWWEKNRAVAWGGFVAAFALVGGGLMVTAVQDLPLRFWPDAETVFPDGRGDYPSLYDWRRVCQWVREHLPSDARVLSPRSHKTFKWHAQRPEVTTWKDVPQDAKCLVEWHRTQRELWEDPYGRLDGWYMDIGDRWDDPVASSASAAEYEASARVVSPLGPAGSDLAIGLAPLFAEMTRREQEHAWLLEMAEKYGFDYVIAFHPRDAEGRPQPGRRLSFDRLYPDTLEENATYEVYRITPWPAPSDEKWTPPTPETIIQIDLSDLKIPER